MDALQYRCRLPVEGPLDVVVAGGGPSGVAAAVAASRMGCQVALIEQTGCLGGLGTSGLVGTFCIYSDGERTLVGGIGLEIIEALYSRGFLAPGSSPEIWQRTYMRGVGFQVEGFKLLMDEMTNEAGVRVRFFTSLIDAIVDGPKVSALVLAGKEGMYAMRARHFVDATGDAVLCDMAGFPSQVGDERGDTQAPTLCSLVTNIDVECYQASRHRTRRPGDWQGLDAVLEQAISDGAFTLPDRHLSGISISGEGFGSLNAGHLYGLNGLQDRDLTQGMLLGRKTAQEYLSFYRSYVEGCEHLQLLATAPVLGVRETRRIVGEYVLNVDDFLSRRSFHDEIGRYSYAVDVHPSNPSREDFQQLIEEFTVSHRLPPGVSYGIPYRSLIPKGSENLLTAGRSISADRSMQGSTRPIPCCFVTGQAAGVAAALCAQEDVRPQDLDAGMLQNELREQGAYIP